MQGMFVRELSQYSCKGRGVDMQREKEKGRKKYYRILSFFLSTVMFLSVCAAVQATEIPETEEVLNNIRITGSVTMDDGSSPTGIRAELYETPFYSDTVRYSSESSSPIEIISLSADGTYAFSEVPEGNYSLVFVEGTEVYFQDYSVETPETVEYTVSMKNLPMEGETVEEILVCVENIVCGTDRDVSVQLHKKAEEVAEVTESVETGESKKTTESIETGESKETPESTETGESKETPESAETGESKETPESVETGETKETSETKETGSGDETENMSDRVMMTLGDEMAAAATGLSGSVPVDRIDAGGILVNYPIYFTKEPSKVIPSGDVVPIENGQGVNKTYPGCRVSDTGFDSLSLEAGTLDKDISMRYCDVASYNGQSIDVVVRCTSVKNGHPHEQWNDFDTEKQWYYPTIQFRTENIGVYTTAISDARFDFKFYKAGTDEIYPVAGNATLYDLDGIQSATIFGADQAYITKDSAITLDKDSEGNTVFRGIEGLVDNDSPSVPGNCCVGFVFDRGRIAIRFTDGRYTSGKTSFFGFGTEGVMDSDLQPPAKSVSDVTALGDFEEFNYRIEQTVPYLHENNTLRRFEIEDTLAGCLEFTGKWWVDYRPIENQHYTTMGDTLRDQLFTVEFNEQTDTVKFTAKGSPQMEYNPDFYAKDYRFRFQVRPKNGYDLRTAAADYVVDAVGNTEKAYTLNENGQFDVLNVAKRTSRLKSQNNSETVYTNVVTVSGQLKQAEFLKVDGTTNEAITGKDAEFELYYGAEPNGTLVGKCFFDTATGKIRLPYLPYITSTDGAAYYLKETAPPAGYVVGAVRTISQGIHNGDITLHGDDVVKNYKPDIVKEMISEKYVKKGETITYKLTLQNPGTEPLKVTLRDVLPWQLDGNSATYVTASSENQTPGASQAWKNNLSLTLPKRSTQDNSRGWVTVTITAKVKTDFDISKHENNTIVNQAFMDYTLNGKTTTEETEKVYNYLSPTVDFTLEKKRVTEPATPSDGSVKAFLPGDGTEILYEAVLKNTGNCELNVTVDDAFEKAGNFTFVSDIRQTVHLQVGETKTVTFKAKIKDGVLANPAYRNTVTATAIGEIKNAETGMIEETKPLTKTADAETPVMWGFYKINDKGQPLVNLTDKPEFTLYSDAACKNQAAVSGYDKTRGLIYFENYLTGLGANRTFYMKETHTPSNYWENTAVYKVTTNSEGRVSIVPMDAGNTSVMPLTTAKNGVDGIGIINKSNPGAYELPNSGGMGTYLFTIGGVLLMTAAILLFLRSRKKG